MAAIWRRSMDPLDQIKSHAIALVKAFELLDNVFRDDLEQCRWCLSSIGHRADCSYACLRADVFLTRGQK